MLVIEVRRTNVRVMSFATVYDEMLRVVCACDPQSGKPMEEKEICVNIYQENGTSITRVNRLLELEILADRLEETLMNFRGFTEDLVLAKEIKREGCC